MFSPPQHEIQSLVVLGGGTAGWMTAAALARLLPANHYSITLVESDAIGTVGVGEATLPHLRFFNQRLGIDEQSFIRATNATFKVGIEFSNWGAKGDSYIHPFGDYGASFGGIGFQHYFHSLRKTDPSLSMDEFSLPVMACLANKFEFPTTDPQLLSSTYSYAYHIDAGQYASFLRNFAEQHGVVRIEGKVDDVVTRVSDGGISELILQSGQRIHGDFFIDCSGFRGRLIEQTLQAGYTDWSQWLPCNRAIAIPSELDGQPRPYTRAIARDAGWQWQIPLNHRMGNGYVYCDQFIDQQQALDTLRKNLPGKALAEPNYLRFLTGKRNKSWSHNCVAIGLSSGFLEPLESTSIYLIQAAIMKLVELLPQRANCEIKAKEYNRYFDTEMERIRDFLILHYHATERDDTPFWQYCKDMSIPASLAEKMALYREFGVIEKYQYGLFLEPSWLAVYQGQRIIPQRTDMRVNQTQLNAIKPTLATMRQQIKDQVAKMQSHSEVLASLHPADSTVFTIGNEASLTHQGLNQPANFSLYGQRG